MESVGRQAVYMKKIKYLVMDVDGTLTDGKIYMGSDGELFKAFNIKDGCGIHDLLPIAAITPVIITGRSSLFLENRCKEIGVDILWQGQKDKVMALKEILAARKGNCCEVAYIGDDINDLSCMNVIKESGGIVGCPADAVERVKAIADFVSNYKGGEGAVREFIDWLIEQG